ALQMAGAGDFTRSHATDEDIAFPFGETVAGVERHAGNSDRWHPEHDRRFEALMRGLLRLPWPLVRTSVTHDGPAIVAPGPDDVDLVAAIRTIFVLPNFAGSRMNRQTERRAMTHRVDLGPVSVAADEGIVGRNTAVIAKPQHFSAVALGILRIVAAIGHED